VSLIESVVCADFVRGSGELCRGSESMFISDYPRLPSVFRCKSSPGLVSRSRSLVVDTPLSEILEKKIE
jgi:hypothetical protein